MDQIREYYTDSIATYPIYKRDILLKFHPDKFPLNLKEELKIDNNLHKYVNHIFSDLLQKYPIKNVYNLIKILDLNRKYITYIPRIWYAIYNLNVELVETLLKDGADPNTFVLKNDLIQIIENNGDKKETWRLDGNIMNILEYHLFVSDNHSSILYIMKLLLMNGNNQYVRILEQIIFKHKIIKNNLVFLDLFTQFNIDLNVKMYFNNLISLLPFCIANGSFKQLEIFFNKCKVNIHLLDKQSNNLIHYAACRTNNTIDDKNETIKIIEFLLHKKKFNLEKKNKSLLTPYQIALDKKIKTNTTSHIYDDILLILLPKTNEKKNSSSSEKRYEKKKVQTVLKPLEQSQHKYKNKFYNIETGIRGGKYIIANNKKIYIRKTNYS